MIKIEFNDSNGANIFLPESNADSLKLHFEFSSQLKSVIPYIPTQCEYLDRSFILQQLGISKEQDEQMQQKYK